MILNTIICDDMLGQIDLIQIYIENMNIPNVKVVKTITDGSKLIETCKELKPGLIILDIELHEYGEYNGMDLAKKIYEFDKDVSFIFITAHKDFSIESYKVRAVDFIVKPFQSDRLKESIEFIINKRGYNNKWFNNRIDVVSSGTIYKIDFNNIIFIEALNRKIVIHTIEEEIEVNDTLDNILSMLNPIKFKRSQKSFIVNIDKIKKIKGGNSKHSSKIIYFCNYQKTAYLGEKYDIL